MNKDYDSYVLDNQIVASEGKLPYTENGKVVWKWKRWENLKNFIGKKVPIVDEHPIDADGKPILVNTNTKTYGYAIFKQCPTKNKVLCAKLELDDDAPKRKGYSIGFVYSEDKPRQEEDADLAQVIQNMDHLALTDFMRNDIARREVSVSGDTSENNAVNKYYIGYDSFKFQPIVDNRSDKSVKTMSAEDLKILKEELDSLRKENAELKGKKAAALKKDLDSKIAEYNKLKSEYEKRENEFKKIKSEYDSLKKEREQALIAEMDSKRKALLKIGVKPEELKDKTFDYINGRYVQASFDAKRRSNVVVKEVKSGQDGTRKFRSTNDYRWDGEKWV
ncbi:MAG: hypothetical protein ACTSR3_01165 [Candidatus Helarchaeota archaeon]